MTAVTDPLFAELTRQAIARLESGEFTVVGIGGGGTLKWIAEYVKTTFDIVELDRAVVIVCQRSEPLGGRR